MKLLYFIVSLFILFSCSKAENFYSTPEVKSMLGQKLQLCPDTPNCINTEYADQSGHYFPPLVYPESKKSQIMSLVKTTISDMGGKVETLTETYLAATFTSSIFRFIDDFEIRNDVDENKIQIRSASRVGYSDFGVNKKRVELFSERLKKNF